MSRSQDDLVARASDPNAELATLHELAQNYPGLRPYIATNPRTYPALLDWLATLGDPAVDAALASRATGHPAAGDAVAPTSVLSSPTADSAAMTALPTPQSAPTVSAASAAQPATQTYPASTSPRATAAVPPVVQPGPSPVGVPQPATWAGGSDSGVFGVGVAESQEPSGRRRSTIVLAILAAVALVLVISIVVWFSTSGGDEPTASAPTGQAQQEQAPATQDAPTQETSPSAEPSPTPSPTPTQSQALRAPAPTGAVEMGSFSAPSGNIACTLGEDSVSCTINEHHFTPEDASCSSDPTAPFTVTVTKDGQALGSCGGAGAVGGAALSYGSSAKNDSFACTATEAAISCWSQVSGQGFSLSREDALGTVR
ncbi:hypothetical protein [Actinomyces faecalis]|uniref:variant leucine-rich repeat-containing protein n=1 Tax=Actinomyces faecalis TaxID=2722820 RepID=UPI0015534831|nr:hypothetical protein [Actinomyces faecalis]